ncbi:MAG: bifunctional diguanylate cyclase/phosphodiesterase [Treponemataceae bacterium]|nr:bifunctional diguanylate cyclase/phosphodiesterase [Treponemataceae bacterium]
MKKNNFSFISKNIDKNFNMFQFRKQMPKFVFVLILVLYLITSVLVISAAKSEKIIILFGIEVPVTIFTGVFSSFSSICIIWLVVFFRKTGFITSFILLFIQLPLMLINFFVRHNSTSIPGVFMNFFTAVAIVIIYINDTIIEKYQEKIRYQAVTDTLTGLPNRFSCTELIDNFVKGGTAFTVVSIDLNNFKSINDTMGHEIGNKVLQEIASRWDALAKSRRTNTVDFVARIGGDEFALVIIGYKNNTDVLDTINAYREEIERVITIDNYDYYVTAGFGYAKYPTDSRVGISMLACADAALYAVKQQGINNNILRFTPGFLESERSIEMVRKIRSALSNQTVFFYLQPQYDLSHKLRGFEALARMKDSDGKLINPFEFIPVAEKNGLIDLVDMTVFRQAVKFLADVIQKGNTDVTMSVNVSIWHLMKNSFIEEIREVIESNGVPADHIELEVTESIMVNSAEKALRRINEVKKMGLKVAIDNFGTGYSSLSYLNKIPSDSLKIDKSFITAMNGSEASKQYVASIVSIGHILNLKVISEGVETPDQIDALREIGCDYVQGYYWGRPIPPEEAAKLV